MFSFSKGTKLHRYLFGKYNLLISDLLSCTFTAMRPRNFVHTHDCYELCYVKGGMGVFAEGKTEFPIETGDIFIGKPYLSHEIILRGTDPLEISFLTFSIVQNKETSGYLPEDETIEQFLRRSFTVVKNRNQTEKFIDLIGIFDKAGSTGTAEKLLSVFLLDLLQILSAATPVQTIRDNETYRAVTKTVLENPDRRITVGMLCESTHLSERALFYFFKNELSTTPVQYINTIKISTAAAYLKMGFPLYQVVDMLGFSDLSSFSRTFKKYTSVCPRDYIKQWKTSIAEKNPG